MIELLITRTDGVFHVNLIKHKLKQTYSYVNLTKGHICPCEFESVEEALEDLNMYDKIIKVELLIKNKV